MTNPATFKVNASNRPKDYECNKIRARNKKDWRRISEPLPILIHLLIFGARRRLDFQSKRLAEQGNERAVKHSAIVGVIWRKQFCSPRYKFFTPRRRICCSSGLFGGREINAASLPEWVGSTLFRKHPNTPPRRDQREHKPAAPRPPSGHGNGVPAAPAD